MCNRRPVNSVIYDIVDAKSNGLKDIIELSLTPVILVEIERDACKATCYHYTAESVDLNIEAHRSLLSEIEFERLAVSTASKAFEIEQMFVNFNFFVTYKNLIDPIVQ